MQREAADYSLQMMNNPAAKGVLKRKRWRAVMGNLLKRIWEKIVDYSNYNREEVVSDLKSEAGRQLPGESQKKDKDSNDKQKSSASPKLSEMKSVFRKRENAVKGSEAEKTFYSRRRNKNQKKTEKKAD